MSVGDSHISGEAARWAGNTNMEPGRIDALGSSAYFDNATHTGEQIPRCHRSWHTAGEAFLGQGTYGLNLACSGAKTVTFVDVNEFTRERSFKPGLDFWGPDLEGRMSQPVMLRQFAGNHNVKMIPLSIGGNDFNFGKIVRACWEAYMFSSADDKRLCKDDPAVQSNLTPEKVAERTEAIRRSILTVREAMIIAGYNDSDYTILVQNYQSHTPNGYGFRYPESDRTFPPTFPPTRQGIGGCGLWNEDSEWVNVIMLPTINAAIRNAVDQTGLANVHFLDIASAFDGRRLCEINVGLLEEQGLSDWRDAGAVDVVEWINQIRTVTTSGDSPYYLQEGLHANYWGTLALRACVRLAYDRGSSHGGRCTIFGRGLNEFGEPRMVLRSSVSVPNVVGETASQAVKILGAAGLRAATETDDSCNSSGYVIGQFPEGGTSLWSGDTVAILVGTGIETDPCL